MSAENLPQISGRVAWRSPSNIALVKYWGKYGEQLPQNPSLSFTLKNSFTETIVQYHTLKNHNQPVLDFYFEGKKNEPFSLKIQKYFDHISPNFPFLKNLHLHIESSNSFPHSAGIASSASGMSALVLCLCSIEQELRIKMGFEPLSDTNFLKKVSYFARLASGSACRSVYPDAAAWGFSEAITGSSDEFAVSFSEFLHPNFRDFRDDILMVSKSEKSVSSRAGHALMNGNPYAQTRYVQAKNNLYNLSKILQSGDLESFIKIAENEALTLHALMMMSNPSFILLEPNTLQIIAKIRHFRAETYLPIAFTIDAGPNIHLLYPAEIRQKVASFIESELLSFFHDKYYISDKMGKGAIKIE